eukprot:COSAG02_NODE_55604_length_289_cov_1.221053_1_plen_69_part_10
MADGWSRLEQMQRRAARTPSDPPQHSLSPVANDRADDQNLQLQRDAEVDLSGSEASPRSESSPMYGSPL